MVLSFFVDLFVWFLSFVYFIFLNCGFFVVVFCWGWGRGLLWGFCDFRGFFFFLSLTLFFVVVGMEMCVKY